MKQALVTTIKLSPSIHQKMLAQIIEDGYGMRGKSRWIQESIASLLSLENYPELVDIAVDIENLRDVISVRLNSGVVDQVEKAIIEVRKCYPRIEGVRSNIIRAGILQRMIGNTTSVTEVDTNQLKNNILI
jgi:hypothetical protein